MHIATVPVAAPMAAVVAPVSVPIIAGAAAPGVTYVGNNVAYLPVASHAVPAHGAVVAPTMRLGC